MDIIWTIGQLCNQEDEKRTLHNWKFVQQTFEKWIIEQPDNQKWMLVPPDICDHLYTLTFVQVQPVQMLVVQISAFTIAWVYKCPSFNNPLYKCPDVKLSSFTCDHCSTVHCTNVRLDMCLLYNCPLYNCPLYNCPLYNWLHDNCPLYMCPLYRCASTVMTYIYEQLNIVWAAHCWGKSLWDALLTKKSALGKKLIGLILSGNKPLPEPLFMSPYGIINRPQCI